MIKKAFYALFLIFFISCKKNIRSEIEVYNNNFETGNLTNIKNGVISQFNGSSVLGNYNNRSFSLTVDNLPKHNLITVSFDLYIHDDWNGNKSAPDGPDVWEMLVDGNPYINTTFSNEPCSNAPGVFCPPQAYPLNYPNNNHAPKTGAFRTDLPGFCSLKSSLNGTTQYKIEKTFDHTNKTLVLECLDKLVQTNVSDPKCDESWSVDNISIKAISL
jgi:hypothetical protein